MEKRPHIADHDDTDPIAAASSPRASGEATILHRPGATDGPRGSARLVVLAGPRTGLEVPIAEEEVSVGRGAENLLVLPDISVSRRHAVLRRENGSYVLFDERSGNGTRLNGKPVVRAPLRSGDRIALGDSVVEFVDPGEKTGHKPSSLRRLQTTSGERKGLVRRSPYLFVGGGALLVLLAAGAWRKHERDVSARLAARQAQETRALAAERFAEAKTLLAQGRWSDAQGKLRIATELNPRDREIADYLKRADDEAPHARSLLEARAALLRKDFSSAQTALAAVPDDSALAEAARDLRAQFGQAMDEAVRDARAKADANDSTGAGALIASVLAADPSRADALAVQGALSQKNDRPKVRRTPGGRSRVARPSPAVPGGAIEKAYLAGDLAGAIDFAERAKGAARSAKALGELRGFEAAYREGFAQLQAGRAREAIAALERANGFDRALVGTAGGPLGSQARKALSGLRTRAALELTREADLPRAAAPLRKALEEDPSNERARRELETAMGRAHEEYMRGYVAKDSDPELARGSFRIAAESLPPQDPDGQKARRWLEKLSGQPQAGEAK